jgi:hypothetical protein
MAFGSSTGPERALPVELRVPPDRGQRRPQLMAGVGGELPHLLLGLQARAEGLLDPVQHRVDRPRQPAGLVIVIGIGHPRGQVAAAGDQVRGPGHLAQRRQTAADQPAAAERDQREQHRAGDQLGAHQAADLAGDGGHGAPDEDDVPPHGQRRVGGPAGGDDPAPDHPQRRLAGHREVERLVAGGQGAQVGHDVVVGLPAQGAEHADQLGGGPGAWRQLAGGTGARQQVRGGEAVRRRGDQGDRLPGGQLELRVELILLELAEREAADHPHHHQEDGGQRDQAGQQAGAQGQRPAALGCPRAGRGHGRRRL